MNKLSWYFFYFLSFDYFFIFNSVNVHSRSLNTDNGSTVLIDCFKTMLSMLKKKAKLISLISKLGFVQNYDITSKKNQK